MSVCGSKIIEYSDDSINKKFMDHEKEKGKDLQKKIYLFQSFFLGGGGCWITFKMLEKKHIVFDSNCFRGTVEQLKKRWPPIFSKGGRALSELTTDLLDLHQIACFYIYTINWNFYFILNWHERIKLVEYSF